MIQENPEKYPRKRDDWGWWETHQEYLWGSAQRRLNLEIERGYYKKPRKGGSGWIGPRGEFAGCAWANHNSMAIVILGVAEEQLEKEGWVKACGQRWRFWHRSGRLTSAQKKVIDILGGYEHGGDKRLY